MRVRRGMVVVFSIGAMLLSIRSAGASPQRAGADATSAAAPHVVLLPGSVGRGGFVTVLADHLPGPADAYCVYFQYPRQLRPLAHFVPPGYGEQVSPLIPVPGTHSGVGSYQTWFGVSGTYRVSIASCTAGAEPKSVHAVASARLTIKPRSAAAAFGLRVIGDTPLGKPFTVSVARRPVPTCLFLAPEDVFATVRILPGVRLGTGRTSAALTVPRTSPWSVYQILWTRAAAKGACSLVQIRRGSLLGSAAWAPGRSALSLESEGVPSAGSGVAVTIDRSLDSGAASRPLCLSAWSAGRFTGIERTYSGQQIGGNATVHLPLPHALSGELTLAGTNGACPSSGTPRHVDAYTVTAIAAAPAVPPVVPPLPKPVRPKTPAALPPCSAVQAGVSTPSPAQGDPRIAYSTFLGKGAANATAVAIDAPGDAWITLATSWYSGCLVEVSPAGDRVLLAGALPGSPRQVAVDAGSVWVAGTTGRSAYLVKLNPAGRVLLRLDLPGGDTSPDAITADRAGNIYIAGGTFETAFPTTPGAYQRRYRSADPGCPPSCRSVSSSGFVVKLTPNGTIRYSTYLGSMGSEADGIAVDAGGNAYVDDGQWPLCHPARLAVVELNAQGTRVPAAICLSRPQSVAQYAFGGPIVLDGNELIAAGVIGLTALDRTSHHVLWTQSFPGHVNALGADASGTIYAGGVTASGGLPTVQPIQAHYHGGICGIEDASHPCNDAFVVQVSPAGKLRFSTYLGGKKDDTIQGLTVAGPGRIIIAGSTYSTDFPVSRALQPSNRGQKDTTNDFGGRLDGFVVEVSGIRDQVSGG